MRTAKIIVTGGAGFIGSNKEKRRAKKSRTRLRLLLCQKEAMAKLSS